MPTIPAKVFEGQRWIKVEDHVADVKRYKDVIQERDNKISNQAEAIITLQKKLIEKAGKPLGEMGADLFEGIFGSKKKQ